MKSKDRDTEKAYPLPEFIAKLRRLADSLETGKRFEIEIAGEAAKPPDIDDPAHYGRRFHVLVRNAARDLIDDQVNALAPARFDHVRADKHLAIAFLTLSL